MTTKRKIEIFSAGSPFCKKIITQVKETACPSCHVTVLNINSADSLKRAKDLDIRSVPAVVIDGKLADCCSERGPDLEALKAAGLGQPIT